MTESSKFTPSRRNALFAGAATLAFSASAARASGQSSAAAVVPVAEAHAHLFNAADLPVVGFIKYVLVPNHANQLGRVARALIDFASRLIKSFAKGAAWELERIQGAGLEVMAEEEITPDQFGRLVAVQVNSGRESGGDAELAESTDVFALALAAYADRGDAELRAEDITVAEAQVGATQLARDIDALGGLDPDRADSAARASKASFGVRGVLQLVGWLYLMVKSRRKHVEVYLKAFRAGDARTTLVINHLIDYDRWLHDGPATDSGHETQIQFWQAFAPKAKAKYGVDIHTFGGVCPLKQAELTAGGDTQPFAKLKKAFDDKAIAGLKIYPPMGFYPIGNKDFPNAHFGASPGIGNLVVDHWAQRYPGKSIGQHLDGALLALYDWCVARDVPMMAHAGRGNEAGEYFGFRADPYYWAKVLDYEDAQGRKPYANLRLSLGHFVENGADFADAVLDGELSDEWALGATRDLLRRPNVYTDLGFMDELLSRAAQRKNLAKRFFEALHKYMREVEGTPAGREPTFSKILYGSDWIMLGQIVGNQKYLQVMRDGMRDARYSPRAIKNICELNARRFLKLP